jgi:hypothetical protein
MGNSAWKAGARPWNVAAIKLCRISGIYVKKLLSLRLSDGDDADFRIDLILYHVFDGHQRSGE